MQNTLRRGERSVQTENSDTRCLRWRVRSLEPNNFLVNFYHIPTFILLNRNFFTSLFTVPFTFSGFLQHLEKENIFVKNHSSFPHHNLCFRLWYHSENQQENFFLLNIITVKRQRRTISILKNFFHFNFSRLIDIFSPIHLFIFMSTFNVYNLNNPHMSFRTKKKKKEEKEERKAKQLSTMTFLICTTQQTTRTARGQSL